MIPMNFTTNTSNGYWTFKDCLDQTENVESKFTYSFQETKHSNDIEKTQEYAMGHLGEMELY